VNGDEKKAVLFREDGFTREAEPEFRSLFEKTKRKILPG
jgi:hypothetical protein